MVSCGSTRSRTNRFLRRSRDLRARCVVGSCARATPATPPETEKGTQLDVDEAPEAVEIIRIPVKEVDGEGVRVGSEEDDTETEDGSYDDDSEDTAEDYDEFSPKDYDGCREGREDSEEAKRDKGLPDAECPPYSGKRVRFDFSATSVHEVTPYAEIYGAHPRTFVFDSDARKIPAARGGFVSASFTVDLSEETEMDDSDSSEEDGGWESWLLEQEEEDGIERRQSEGDERTSILFSRGICVPDLDEETGWESWLDSILGSTDEQLFCDPV